MKQSGNVVFPKRGCVCGGEDRHCGSWDFSFVEPLKQKDWREKGLEEGKEEKRKCFWVGAQMENPVIYTVKNVFKSWRL